MERKYHILGTGSVTVDIGSNQAASVEEAMGVVARVLDERNVPLEHRVGLVGRWIVPCEMFGIAWSHEPRLGGDLVVAWHRAAVIPPAIVLHPEGIVYCAIGKP